MNVAQVDFYSGQFDAGNCVTERIGIVSEGAWIDKQAIRPGARLVNEVDQRAFMVA